MHAELGARPLALWLLLASIVLLPFGVAAEVPVLIGAIAGLAQWLRGRLDWSRPTLRIALGLGLAYWLPEFVSAWDSVAAVKSWGEVALDLRFVLFLLFVTAGPWQRGDARWLRAGIAWVVALWCLDALLQAATGFSVGGVASGDRLSGIFGAENLKLGGVLAVVSPFLMLEAWRWRGARALIGATLILLVVILLAGARAAWFGFALGAALVFWQAFGRRTAVLALSALLLAAGLTAVFAYGNSQRFAERVDRTAAALAGDRDALDHALSGRLAIWETAARMGWAHPVNGVGVRGFRHVYPDFAAADDPFVDGDQGAFHAHQIVLELWSETGLIGLLIWLVAIAMSWRALRSWPAAARRAAAPATIALVVALFPLNTHYAVYSGFWGLLLIWLIAVWLALLAADQS